jgi:hypothetical protein
MNPEQINERPLPRKAEIRGGDKFEELDFDDEGETSWPPTEGWLLDGGYPAEDE